MQNRLRLSNGRQFIETHTDDRVWLEEMRKIYPELFKGRRIKEVIQTHPGEVEVNVIHNLD